MNAGVDDNPELERTRRELAMVRRQLELTLDVAGAPCAWEWDIRRARLVADVRFAAITQQDPVALADGVSTDNFFKSIHLDDLKRVKLAVAGMLAGSEVFSKEYRLLKADGGYRWVHAKGRAIFDEDDEPASFVGILIDITDQKRITEELRVAQSAGGIGTFEHKIGWATVTPRVWRIRWLSHTCQTCSKPSSSYASTGANLSSVGAAGCCSTWSLTK